MAALLRLIRNTLVPKRHSETLIDKLVEAWEVAKSQGEQVSIAELCSEYPELEPEVLRRIERLLSVDDLVSLDEEPGQPEAIGDYVVLSELGRGAAAIVYLCKQQSPRRDVAIKLFNSNSPTLKKRFEREAKILGNLRHEGIARVFEYGRTPERRPYLVMEYIDGLPLDEFADSNGLSTASRIRLVRDLCEAVYFAHRAGVVHRDLKPANILVDSAGRPIILDFGIAKLAIVSTDSITTAADVDRLLGTLPYMAPEQVDAGSVDFRADIYSLGVILFQLCTGELPIDTREIPIVEAVALVKTKDPTPLRAIDKTQSRELEAVLATALQKNPADRYLSVEEFSDDLKRLLERRPVKAKPLTIRRQLGSFLIRHPILVSAVTVACIVTLVLTLALLQQRRIAAKESQKAEREHAVRTQTEQRVNQLQRAKKASDFDETLQLILDSLPHDVSTAATLLNDTERCPEDLRGFSWSFLKLMTDRVTWSSHHKARPHAIDLEQDGSAIFVGYRNGDLIRHSEDSKTKFELPNRASVLTLDFDESSGVLFAGTRDGRVYSWDASEPSQPSEWQLASALEVSPIRLVSAEKPGYLLVVNERGQYEWIERESRESVLTKDLGFKAVRCDYSVDNDFLAIGNSDVGPLLYDTKRQRRIELNRPPGKFFDLAFFSSGQLLAEANGLMLLIYDTEKGKWINNRTEPSQPWRLGASRLADRLVIADRRSSLSETTFRDFPKVNPLSKSTRSNVRAIEVSASGRMIAYASADGHSRVVDLLPWSGQTQTMHHFLGLGTAFQALDKTRVFVATESERHFVFDCQDNSIREVVGLTRSPRIITYHATTKRLATASLRKTAQLKIIDTHSATVSNSLKLPAGITALSFLDSGKLLVGTIDGGIHRVEQSLEVSETSRLPTSVQHIVSNEDGTTWACTKVGKIYQVGNSPSEVASIGFQPARVFVYDDQLIAVGKKKQAAIVSLSDGTAIEIQFAWPGVATAMALTPDGESLLVGTSEGSLCFMNIQTGKVRYEIKDLFVSELSALTFSSKGDRLFALDMKGRIQIWDTSF